MYGIMDPSALDLPPRYAASLADPAPGVGYDGGAALTAPAPVGPLNIYEVEESDGGVWAPATVTQGYGHLGGDSAPPPLPPHKYDGLAARPTPKYSHVTDSCTKRFAPIAGYGSLQARSTDGEYHNTGQEDVQYGQPAVLNNPLNYDLASTQPSVAEYGLASTTASSPADYDLASAWRQEGEASAYASPPKLPPKLRQTNPDQLNAHQVTLFLESLFGCCVVISSAEAAKLLREGGDVSGTYVIRTSSTQKGLVLSFLHGNQVLHERIEAEESAGGVSLCGRSFSSLCELLEVQRSKPIGRTQTTLTRCCPRVSGAVQQALQSVKMGNVGLDAAELVEVAGKLISGGKIRQMLNLRLAAEVVSVEQFMRTFTGGSGSSVDDAGGLVTARSANQSVV